ncbi:hypothetical protein HDV02_005407 [Globomyces sp. JEL0801]|nr:hypothetical protein HDV02_005407 [Globomyces sp. JEL0801]
MSSPPSPMVWFLLLDSAYGLPYKGTSADYVCLPPASVIAQFREAVQLEYDKPNYLRDIPSSALLVYKNKSSFDKRNAAVEDGQEQPLKSSHSLDNLGTTVKEALIVVVSSSADTSSEKFTANDILLAIRDLTLEIRNRNKFLKKIAKNDFSFLIPKL